MGHLEDMQSFVQIVEHGSISKAASQLGVVKSSISRRLNDLETRLGTQLINRTTRKLTLTQAGEIYFDQSKNIIAQIEDQTAQANENSKKLSGSIKISAPVSFGMGHLAPKINAFADLHPEVKIHIDFNDQLVDLIEHSYDIAIRISDLKDSSLKAVKLADMHGVLTVSPEYLENHPEIEHPIDLKDHQILHYHSLNSEVWKFTNKNGASVKVPVAEQIRIRSNNGDYLKDACIDGLGVCGSPAFMVYDDIKKGKLISILEDYTAANVAVYAVYPETKYLTKRVRSLIDFLKVEFAYPNLWD